MKAVYQDGCAVFETEHFSRYIVKYIPQVISVQINGTEIYYKNSAQIVPVIECAEGTEYTCKFTSSDSKVVSVDDNGNIYGGKRGSAVITCTVTDSTGKSVSGNCTVNVKYTWWQWIIKIVLFGWIWY